jgi:hypothetical protein
MNAPRTLLPPPAGTPYPFYSCIIKQALRIVALY